MPRCPSAHCAASTDVNEESRLPVACVLRIIKFLSVIGVSMPVKTSSIRTVLKIKLVRRKFESLVKEYSIRDVKMFFMIRFD